MFGFYLLVILSAPGVMVHELAHALFCLVSGVRIRKIVLFRINKNPGYVIHDEPNSVIKAFLIAVGPLIVNSYLSLYLFTKVFWPLTWQGIIWFWLALVIGLHAIPSDGDSDALKLNAKRNWKRRPLALIFYPIALILNFLNFLKRFYLDIAYVLFLFYIAKTIFIKYI